MLGLGLNIWRGVSGVGMPPFAISRLFDLGEQGFWYDHNDLTIMFQDSAGTVPSAVGMPVGLKLDKSGNGNHASFGDGASRPILRLNATTGFHYLEMDGVDDGGVTSPIDFTGTDKVSLFAGIRKVSNPTTAVFMELSASSSTNNGTFAIFAPPSGASPTYTSRSRGTLISDAISAMSFTEPNSAVLSIKAQISTDTNVLRANGSQTGSSSSDQGAGNYGNHPLYLYRRGGATLPFNGHSYGEIGVGRLTTAAEDAAIEQMFALRTGAALV